MALIIMFHTRNLAAVSLNDILFLKAFDHRLIRNRFRLNLLFFDFLKDSKFYKNIACASDILAQRQQISQLLAGNENFVKVTLVVEAPYIQKSKWRKFLEQIIEQISIGE